MIMITSREFDAALQLIANYKIQLENGLNKDFSNRIIISIELFDD